MSSLMLAGRGRGLGPADALGAVGVVAGAGFSGSSETSGVVLVGGSGNGGASAECASLAGSSGPGTVLVGSSGGDPPEWSGPSGSML
jgi:hypothetical protein